MIKKAYSVQMTYDVSDSEKAIAEKALIYFQHASKLLLLASDHLNVMKTPFKDSPDMSPEQVMETRAAIRRFRDKAVENFNTFKIAAFKCVNLMQEFSSDTQTVKLVKSFVSSIDTLESKVNNFVKLFSDLESKELSKKAVESIESVQKQCEEIEDIVDDRIKNHIKNNILAVSWLDSVSDDLQVKIEKKTPIMLDLFQKRQDQLNEAIKENNR